MQTDSVFVRIQDQYNKFSKGHKRLADFVLNNYEQAVFMTAARLGDEVGISESTTVRFAKELGYEGYPEFKQALEELVMTHLNSVQRMEVSYADIPREHILERVLLSDIEKIKQTNEVCKSDAFLQAVDAILSARKVYVVGVRSCAPLAEFLSYYLRMAVEDVNLISTNSINEIFEQMIRIGSSDVVIGISFPRYSQRAVKAMEFAKTRNAKIISITDSVNSPMYQYSDINLLAKSDMASIVDSLVAPLSLINALLVAVCTEKRAEVMATLTEMEALWKEYGVYSIDGAEGADGAVQKKK